MDALRIVEDGLSLPMQREKFLQSEVRFAMFNYYVDTAVFARRNYILSRIATLTEK